MDSNFQLPYGNSFVNNGQEHGKNLIKIAKKLIKNQNLVKLIMNTDFDPLNPKKHPDTIDGLSLLNQQILVVPYLNVIDNLTTSKLVIVFESGEVNQDNSDNENISVLINIYVPFSTWLIAGDDIRPFALMSEIKKSLSNCKINGLGEMRYENFSLVTLSEEMGCYGMRFYINAFN